MKLTHDFGWQHRAALIDMLDGTTKLEQYLKKLRKYSVAQRNPKTPKGEKDSNQLKVIGDGFELFGEGFLKLRGKLDERIYIDDFQRPSNLTDNGVDGIGRDTKTGGLVFIQFKCYRETELLTGYDSHLDSFVAESLMLMRDMAETPEKLKIWPRLVVITSAADIHPYTKEQKYRDRVKCFNHKELQHLTDNGGFWDEFRILASV